MNLIFGPVAQLVERLAGSEKVAGSIPVWSTIFLVLKFIKFLKKDKPNLSSAFFMPDIANYQKYLN